MAVGPVFQRNPEQQERVRVVAFSFLTPFFFLRGGLNVGLGELAGGVPLLGGFFVVKIAAKFAGVLPVAIRYVRPHAMYTTLLMSTALTFGTISSLYGLNAGMINRAQFSILISAVILSAILPTLVAQRFFSPPVHKPTTEEEFRLWMRSSLRHMALPPSAEGTAETRNPGMGDVAGAGSVQISDQIRHVTNCLIYGAWRPG